jgi:hypothetical protein
MKESGSEQNIVLYCGVYSVGGEEETEDLCMTISDGLAQYFGVVAIRTVGDFTRIEKELNNVKAAGYHGKIKRLVVVCGGINIGCVQKTFHHLCMAILDGVMEWHVVVSCRVHTISGEKEVYNVEAAIMCCCADGRVVASCRPDFFRRDKKLDHICVAMYYGEGTKVVTVLGGTFSEEEREDSGTTEESGTFDRRSIVIYTIG